MRNSLALRDGKGVGIASHAVKILNNDDLCKKVTETNFFLCGGEASGKRLMLMISLENSFALRKKAIWHRRALKIILIFANCSLIMDALDGSRAIASCKILPVSPNFFAFCLSCPFG